ncbi:MAG: aminotransferase class V-fold PLP-dependent enzyme [Sphingomonadales bacterium]|jgi:aromatic-L-amino-acid decarboxylase
MDKERFRQHAHELVDWMADYLESVENYPVRSQIQPGEVEDRLPASPPQEGEAFSAIFEDFKSVVMPGITHWQHPKFFAYFPGNSSPPSVLAEMLTASLGTNAMLWQTSPAATEMEIRMVDWLRQACNLDEGFSGSIQTTASEASLSALLMAREKVSSYQINEKGFQDQPTLRVYVSAEAHSSIEKDARIAGYGAENVVKVPADADFSMDVKALKALIAKDEAKGFTPTCVVATLGTTGTGGIDPLEEIGTLCKAKDIFLHVDAAWAGSALILPEWQWMAKGSELADSLVFNPHKWLFTNFDCSVHFVRDKDALIRTFSILPEYLKGATTEVTDFRDWGVPLGRRFRALKLWFVLRSYGITGLQEVLRRHIELGKKAHDALSCEPDFEITSPLKLSLFTFRHAPPNVDDLDAHNEHLIRALNDSGEAYFTQTRVNGKYVIRWQVGQVDCQAHHIDEALALVKSTAARISA